MKLEEIKDILAFYIRNRPLPSISKSIYKVLCTRHLKYTCMIVCRVSRILHNPIDFPIIRNFNQKPLIGSYWKLATHIGVFIRVHATAKIIQIVICRCLWQIETVFMVIRAVWIGLPHTNSCKKQFQNYQC